MNGRLRLDGNGETLAQQLEVTDSMLSNCVIGVRLDFHPSNAHLASLVCGTLLLRCPRAVESVAISSPRNTSLRISNFVFSQRRAAEVRRAAEGLQDGIVVDAHRLKRGLCGSALSAALRQKNYFNFTSFERTPRRVARPSRRPRGNDENRV